MCFLFIEQAMARLCGLTLFDLVPRVQQVPEKNIIAHRYMYYLGSTVGKNYNGLASGLHVKMYCQAGFVC